MRRLNSTTSTDKNYADDDSSSGTSWIRACKLDDLDDGQLYKFEHHDASILITNQNGTICAVDSVCTHADADLSTGFLGPDGIRCPLHLSVFDLCDGVPKNPPAEKPLRVYNVKITDGWIQVGV